MRTWQKILWGFGLALMVGGLSGVFCSDAQSAALDLFNGVLIAGIALMAIAVLTASGKE